jgi:hypothetical protein
MPIKIQGTNRTILQAFDIADRDERLLRGLPGFIFDRPCRMFALQFMDRQNFI